MKTPRKQITETGKPKTEQSRQKNKNKNYGKNY